MSVRGKQTEILISGERLALFKNFSQQAIKLSADLSSSCQNLSSRNFIAALAMEQQNSTVLNPFELEAVLKWVDSFELSRGRKKLNRDFSDAVLLAEVLKFEFPNLVELHNYAGCFSLQGRLQNWAMLNRKVLRKLELHLKSSEIEKLAKAETNYIEEVLFRVMHQIRLIKSRSSAKSEANVPEESSNVMTVKVWKQIGDHVEQVPQRVVQLSLFEELQAKAVQQEKTIRDMQETIIDLQCALSSKTQIIDDLNHQRLEEKKKNKTRQVLSMTTIKESLTNLF